MNDASSAAQGECLPSATIADLRKRAELLGALRRFFSERGFWEVETPLLSADTVVDRHIEPIEVRVPMGGGDGRFWLQTSPEFGMKRLLAAGAQAIYQVTRAFRAEERGERHNPEFTMVEWYRVGDDGERARILLGELASTLLGMPEAEQLSYAAAFERQLGIDPHRAAPAELVALCERQGIAVPAGLGADDRDSWLDLLRVERVEPTLGADRPCVLYDFPAGQAALARIRAGDPPWPSASSSSSTGSSSPTATTSCSIPRNSAAATAP